MAIGSLASMFAGNAAGGAAAQAVTMAGRKAEMETAAATIEKIGEDTDTKIIDMARASTKMCIESNVKHSGLMNF